MFLQRSKGRLLPLLVALIFILLKSPLYASEQRIPLIFWHSMAGQLGVEVNQLIQQFNQTQKEYEVVPVYKGDYIESLTSFAAAFRAKNPPNMIQVFEVGTSVMRFPRGVVKLVDVLLREQGVVLPEDYFPAAVRETYSDHGQLMAFPFNVSIPVIFYNADLLAKFGVTAQTFPKTWEALESLVRRLHQAGIACGYTSAYPTWVLIESYLALHGLAVNGESSEIYHNKHLIAHIKRVRRWQQMHYFEYGGHGDDPTVLFTSERCSMLSQSSGAYAGLSELVPFHLGIAPMPLDLAASSVRHHNVVGGAAIWVVAGQSPTVERGIAQFLAFLALPKVQQAWFEHTGYLPLNHLQSNNQNKNAILDIAAVDLIGGVEDMQTLQQVPKNQIRTINDQMLEAIFSGMLSTEEALHETKVRVQDVLTRFINNTSDHVATLENRTATATE